MRIYVAHSRELDYQFVIGECSYPSVGLGIELGWAFDDKIPIYCIHRKDKKISGSLSAITENIYEYTDVKTY